VVLVVDLNFQSRQLHGTWQDAVKIERPDEDNQYRQGHKNRVVHSILSKNLRLARWDLITMEKLLICCSPRN
jgi:hypothetical protein